MEDKQEEKFSYCIGRPWHPDDPNSAIGTYAYGSEVFHGTTEDAEKMKEFLEGRSEGKKFNIYKLVKI
jgi:hypothetical protein